MPRQPDPLLEGRILEAAKKLYMKGGERALSMRDLAKLAHTNTPAVYRRFRNRKAILYVLFKRYQEDVYRVIQPSSSPQEACQRLLEFFLARPREYQLTLFEWVSRFEEPRPNLEYMKRRLAEWLGGSPQDYSGLALGLWAQLHGTVMLMISKAVPVEDHAELRSIFSTAVDLLVSNASTHR